MVQNMITVPARSPDLPPPDFFLWGSVKDQVYRTPVCDLADLQERIYAAVNNVTQQILHNTWVEVEYQLDISHVTNGNYVDPGGPVVIILATGSEVRWFKPGRGRWIFSERKTPQYDFLRKGSIFLQYCKSLVAIPGLLCLAWAAF